MIKEQAATVPWSTYQGSKWGKRESKEQGKEKVSALKNDCNLSAHLYVASQICKGNIEDFLKHENQLWSPTLPKMVKRTQGQSTILWSVWELFYKQSSSPPTADVTILDGAVVMQMLLPGAMQAFQE